VSNGFFKQDFWTMLQIILWKCGWSAVEAVDFNRTVDFNRERLKCGWKYFSRVSTASTAFQPSQEISGGVSTAFGCQTILWVYLSIGNSLSSHCADNIWGLEIKNLTIWHHKSLSIRYNCEDLSHTFWNHRPMDSGSLLSGLPPRCPQRHILRCHLDLKTLFWQWGALSCWLKVAHSQRLQWLQCNMTTVR